MCIDSFWPVRPEVLGESCLDHSGIVREKPSQNKRCLSSKFDQICGTFVIAFLAGGSLRLRIFWIQLTLEFVKSIASTEWLASYLISQDCKRPPAIGWVWNAVSVCVRTDLNREPWKAFLLDGWNSNLFFFVNGTLWEVFNPPLK